MRKRGARRFALRAAVIPGFGTGGRRGVERCGVAQTTSSSAAAARAAGVQFGKVAEPSP